MSKAVVERNAGTHLARVSRSDIRERSFVVSVTCTEDNDLHAVIEHLLYDTKQKVETLLVNKTGDHGAERSARIDFQTQLFLNGLLVDRFSLFVILDGILRRDHRILCGIILFGIDSV